MAKHKSLLITSEVVTAGRKRKCYHATSHNISKGDKCLEVKDGMAVKGYCVACAVAMLKNAEVRLEELRVYLGEIIADSTESH